MKINPITKTLIKSFTVLILFGLSVQALAVWTAPSATAPNGNVSPPVNVGGATQSKSGGLVVGFFKSFGLAQFEDDVEIKSGNPAAGKVLTAVDGTGLVSWEDAAGGVSSTGTENYIPKFGANGESLADSVIYENPANDRIGIGTTTPNQQLEITGNFRFPLTTTTVGAIYQGPNRVLHSYGGLTNIFVGALAGNTTMNSAQNYNTAIGLLSYNSNTTGSENTAVGANSLMVNTTGSSNVAVGVAALQNNTSGNENTALGAFSLGNNTSSGDHNTAVGYGSIAAITTGDDNAAVGFYSLGNISSGSKNTAIGYDAGKLVSGNGQNNTSTNSIYIGNQSKAGASGNTNEIVIGHLAVGSGSNTTTLGNSSITKNVFYGALAPNNSTGATGEVLTSQGSGTPIWAPAGGMPSGTSGQTIRYDISNNPVANSVLYNNGTNIGIGTTSPNQKLNVIGNITVTGQDKKFISELTSGSSSNWAGLWAGNDLAIFQYPASLKFGIQAGTSQGDNATNNFSMISFGSTRNTMFGEMTSLQTDPGPRVTIKGSTSDNTKVALNVTNSSGVSMLYVRNDGNVGINTSSPTEKLDVVGKIKFSGALMPNNQAGTSGQVLTSAGANNSPTWTSVAGLPVGTANQTLRYNGVTNSWESNGALYNTGTTVGVTGNFEMPNTTSTVGTLTKGGSRFLHNYGNSHSTFVGVNAGSFSNATSDITGVGYEALSSITTGPYNTALGSRSLKFNTVGNSNTAVGASALEKNINGHWNTSVGSFALHNNTSGSGNTAIGENALISNITNSNNTAVGKSALRNNTAGNNTAVGHSALFDNTSGSYNTSLGYYSLVYNVSAQYNTAVGSFSLKYAMGTGNTGLGYQALQSNAAGSNAQYNTAVGYQALVSNSNGGSFNTALGYKALEAVTSGSNNVAIGREAGVWLQGGSANVAIGWKAGPESVGLAGTIAIGTDAVPTDNNQIQMGGPAIEDAFVQVPWAQGSDRRFKKDIKDLDLGLDFITSLRPVSYKLKTQTDDEEAFGFIAQELESALNGRQSKLVNTQNTEDAYKYVRYDDLIAPAINAIQELKAENDSLKVRIEALENKLK